MAGGLHRWGDGAERDGAFHVCAWSKVDPIDATAQRRMCNAGEPVYTRVEKDLHISKSAWLL